MLANQAAQDAIAQNLANAATTGYKRDLPQFQSFRETLLRRTTGGGGAAIGALGPGAGVSALATDFADGALQQTGNPLDVAISGQACLAVQTPQGVRYTRDGALTRNAQGLLVQANGGSRRSGPGGPPDHHSRPRQGHHHLPDRRHPRRRRERRSLAARPRGAGDRRDQAGRQSVRAGRTSSPPGRTRRCIRDFWKPPTSASFRRWSP